jgi:four helix bundle protein
MHTLQTYSTPADGRDTGFGDVHVNGDVRLDAEKLDCYRVAVEFHALAVELLPKGHAILRDQLERASLSIVLNLAEGAGRRSHREKSRFYVIARGSATESAAVVDVIRARKLASDEACDAARGLLVRIVQMLSRLVGRPA